MAVLPRRTPGVGAGLIKPSLTSSKKEEKRSSFLEKAKSFIKEIPSGIIRGVASPAEFAARIGSGIGKKATEKLPNIFDALGIRVSEETKKGAKAFQSGLEKPVRIPGTETKIFESKPYGSLREGVGGFGEAAFDTVLNLTTAGAGGSVLKAIGQQGFKKVFAKSIAKETLPKIAKALLVDFSLGAGSGSSIAFQDKEATGKDIAKAGLLGGAVNVIAPRVLGELTHFGLRASKIAGDSLFEGAGRLAGELETRIERKKLAQAASKADEFLFNPERTVELGRYDRALEFAAKRLKDFESLPTKVRGLVETEFAPAGALQKRIAKITGKDITNIPDIENAFQLTKLSGRDGQARVEAYKTGGALKYGKDVWNIAMRYSNYLDRLDRIASGLDIEKGLSKEEVVKSFIKFKRSIEPKIRNEVEGAVGHMQRTLDRELQDLMREGVIDRAAYQRIKAEHPNYVPHRVLDFVDPERNISATPIKGGKSTTAGALELKKAKGSLREVETNVDTAITAKIIENASKRSRQAAVNRLFEAVKGIEEKMGFKKIDEPLKTIDVPRGFEQVNVLRDGQKQTYLVPKDIGMMLKNYDDTALEGVFRWLSGTSDNWVSRMSSRLITAPAEITRAVAVVANPIFKYFRNPIRDIQNASMFSGLVGLDFVRSLKEAILANQGVKSEAYRMAETYGGFLGTLTRETRDPEKIFQDVIRERNFFGRKMPTGKVTVSGTLRAISSSLEESTRLAVFKRGLEAGVNPEKAALLARTATVDFSKSGRLVKVLNKVIPFLNPAVQGTINMAKLVGKDPTKFYRRAFNYAAVPAATLYAWNNNYESYYNIPRQTRLRNWVIMVGEEEGRDFKGKRIKVPIYVSIPKGEIQMFFTGLLDHSLDSMKEKYPEETADFLSRLAQNANPVGNNIALLPEGYKQWVELKTNYSFFRQGPIEPEWVKVNGKWRQTNTVPPEYRTKESTTEVAKIIGKALGWSPIKIDYVIKFGLLDQIMRLMDIPIKLIEGESVLANKKKDPILLELSKFPILDSILRSTEAGDFASKKEAEEKATLERTRNEIEKENLRRERRTEPSPSSPKK